MSAVSARPDAVVVYLTGGYLAPADQQRAVETLLGLLPEPLPRRGRRVDKHPTSAVLREGRYVRVWSHGDHFRLGPFDPAEADRIAMALRAIEERSEAEGSITASGATETYPSFTARHWPATAPRPA